MARAQIKSVGREVKEALEEGTDFLRPLMQQLVQLVYASGGTPYWSWDCGQNWRPLIYGLPDDTTVYFFSLVLDSGNHQRLFGGTLGYGRASVCRRF